MEVSPYWWEWVLVSLYLISAIIYILFWDKVQEWARNRKLKRVLNDDCPNCNNPKLETRFLCIDIKDGWDPRELYETTCRNCGHTGPTAESERRALKLFLADVNIEKAESV